MLLIVRKGNRCRKALAGNGVVKKWFSERDRLGITAKGIQKMFQK
jgi:hypothetical protein